jgi:hypothetical protein
MLLSWTNEQDPDIYYAKRGYGRYSIAYVSGEEGWVARWHPSRGPLHQGEYLTNVPRLDAAKRACEKHAKEQMQQAPLKI